MVSSCKSSPQRSCFHNISIQSAIRGYSALALGRSSNPFPVDDFTTALRAAVASLRLSRSRYRSITSNPMSRISHWVAPCNPVKSGMKSRGQVSIALCSMAVEAFRNESALPLGMAADSMSRNFATNFCQASGPKNSSRLNGIVLDEDCPTKASRSCQNSGGECRCSGIP